MNTTPSCVYAYGVCEFWTDHKDRSGALMAQTKDVMCLHYWVDSMMQYGEALLPTDQMQEGITFIHGGAYRVELTGPKSYTVKPR